MKCICGSKLEKINTEMDFFDGKVIVKDIEANYCPKCKEELFDSKQGDALFEQVSKLNLGETFESRKRIAKVGNSFAIPISKELADFLQVKKGSEIQIKVRNKRRLVVDLE